MDCEQALESISAALDGELTRAEQEALDAHLSDCPDCRALAEDLGVLSVALSDMEQTPPAALAGNIRAAIAPGSVIPIPAKKRNRRAWTSLAAMLAVVVCLGGVYALLRSSGVDSAAGADIPPTVRSVGGITGTAESAPYAAPEDPAAPEDTLAPPSPQLFSAAPPADSEAVEAPSETTAADSSASQNQEDAGITSSKYNASPAEGDTPSNTSTHALELAFDYLGGYTTWPDAELNEDPDAKSSFYFLRYFEDEAEISRLYLQCDGLSSEGDVYLVHLYETVEPLDGESGEVGYTATWNWFDVSLDGTQVLSQFPFDETTYPGA